MKEVTNLKINITENKELTETEVNIHHPVVLDNETKELLYYLEERFHYTLAYKNERAYRILIQNIQYIESVDEKTFLYLDNDIYLYKFKLYEWENHLEHSSFVRISKNTIVNIHYLKSVRPLLGNRMEATLNNNEHLIINRHYLPTFKKKFGL